LICTSWSVILYAFYTYKIAVDQVNNTEEATSTSTEEATEEAEDWSLYEEKTFNQVSTNAKQDINLHKLAELVFRSIRVYGMELMSIAALAKELTLDVGFTMTENNDTRRIIRQQELENGKKCFLIFKMAKSSKQISSAFGIYYMCHSRHFTFRAEYTILVPNNAAAEKRSNEFINDKIDIKLTDHINRIKSSASSNFT
jgi:hypothetical protein